MEWIISILVTILGAWCAISFVGGLLYTTDDDYYFDNFWLPFKITFIIEICILALALLVIIVCFVKEKMFGG